MRNTFINTIFELSEKRKDLFILSGDAGLGVFEEFREKYPDRYYNMGVAEQNAISMAAGMSLSGLKPLYYNITPFALYRCYEQVRNDICYQRLPVIIVGIGSGVTYAPAGMTHYSVEDLGMAKTLPNLIVLSPIDPMEAKAAAKFAVSSNSPVFVRLAKRGEPNIHKNENIDLTKPIPIKEGEKIGVITYGSIAEEVLEANKILLKRGINIKIISCPMVQPFPMDHFLNEVKNLNHVVCVEEHYKKSGLGSTIATQLLRNSVDWKFHSLGIEDKFIHEIKNQKGMRDLFGISAKKIAKYIENLA